MTKPVCHFEEVHLMEHNTKKILNIELAMAFQMQFDRSLQTRITFDSKTVSGIFQNEIIAI